jgi:F-type H+-transporting ATPase subunit epsilon
VESVVAPGVEGELGILPNHVPLLTKLKDGVAKYRVGGEDRYVGITSAFLDVVDNRVTIVSEAAVLPEEADQARAEEARRQAHEQLEKRLEGTDFRQVEAELRKALLELKLIEHIKR